MKKIVFINLFLFLGLGIWAQQIEKEITLNKRIVDENGVKDFAEIRLSGEAATQFKWQENKTLESVVIRTEEVLQAAEGQVALGRKEAMFKHLAKILTIDEQGVEKEYVADGDYLPQEEWEISNRWFRLSEEESEDRYPILYLQKEKSDKTPGSYQLFWGEGASDCPDEFNEEEIRSIGRLVVKLQDKNSKTLSLRTISTKEISKSEDEVMRLVEIRTETYVTSKE